MMAAESEVKPPRTPGQVRSSRGAMTPGDFWNGLTRLNLSDSTAAELFGVNDRTVRRWINGTSAIPVAVSKLMSVLTRDTLHELLPAAPLTLPRSGPPATPEVKRKLATIKRHIDKAGAAQKPKEAPSVSKATDVPADPEKAATRRATRKARASRKGGGDK